MKILGLIPARGGSKGIPRKNIKLLHGKELIRYTIKVGLQSALIDELVVSTEDQEIAKVSAAAGANIPFLRPKELAADHSPTIDMVIHAMDFFQKENKKFDAVCLLQPTVPFRAIDDLENAIQKFINSDADSLISVREVPHVYNPHWVYEEKEKDGFLKLAIDQNIISRRQDLPKAFHRDGSIYLTKSEIILNEKSLYGEKIMYHIMASSPNINIDTMEDWKLAEQYLKNM